MNNQQYKEDLQTYILRCDENIQRIEERLEILDKSHDEDIQSHLVRSQLEFVLLNTLDQKFSKEQQLRAHEETERWNKEHPMPEISIPAGLPVGFNPNPFGVMPMPSKTGTINPDDVEATVMYHHKINTGLGNVVLRMKAGILLDPASRTIWTPTEDWVEAKSMPGMVL